MELLPLLLSPFRKRKREGFGLVIVAACNSPSFFYTVKRSCDRFSTSSFFLPSFFSRHIITTEKSSWQLRLRREKIHWGIRTGSGKAEKCSVVVVVVVVTRDILRASHTSFVKPLFLWQDLLFFPVRVSVLLWASLSAHFDAVDVTRIDL